MDPYLLAVAAHSLERIVAVLLGGISVYYGFRLFLAVPAESRSDGRVTLPGMSVVLAKAGPGLFFAAFGALVILASLFKPITVQGDAGKYSGATETATQAGGSPGTGRSSRPEERERARLAIQSLDCLQRLAASTAKYPNSEFDVPVRDAKWALMSAAWDDKAWGDPEAFRRWTLGATGTTSSPAKVVFEARRPGC